MPGWIVRALRRFAERTMDNRPPDFTIERDGGPYLHRWFVWPDRSLINCFVHRFVRDDTDGQIMHDHPWANVTVVLDGAYVEHMVDGSHIRRFGDVVARGAEEAHRVTLLRDIDGGFADPAELPSVSLFLTGPKVRDWGFLCPQGWRHWRDYVNPAEPGKIGKGCGDV